MLVGKNVDQNGVIDSLTTVALNGRVDLLADYDTEAFDNANSVPVFYPTASGLVTLGGTNALSQEAADLGLTLTSVTQILPDLTSTATVVGANYDTQLALSSIVNIQGGSIDMAPNSIIYAPDAQSTIYTPDATSAVGIAGQSLSAGVSLDAGTWQRSGLGLSFFNTNGQVYLDANSLIDVSGSQDVSASVLEDIVSAQLLGSQLEDSPLQRDGALRGQTIDVNLFDLGVYDGTPWIGTPVGDISGYIPLIQRTVGELTVNGGTVAINAGSSVAMKPTSEINVSGGWIDYQGADVQTSSVIYGNQIIPIEDATPNLV
jgi:hypothetical protein